MTDEINRRSNKRFRFGNLKSTHTVENISLELPNDSNSFDTTIIHATSPSINPNQPTKQENHSAMDYTPMALLKLAYFSWNMLSKKRLMKEPLDDDMAIGKPPRTSMFNSQRLMKGDEGVIHEDSSFAYIQETSQGKRIDNYRFPGRTERYTLNKRGSIVCSSDDDDEEEEEDDSIPNLPPDYPHMAEVNEKRQGYYSLDTAYDDLPPVAQSNNPWYMNERDRKRVEPYNARRQGQQGSHTVESSNKWSYQAAMPKSPPLPLESPPHVKVLERTPNKPQVQSLDVGTSTYHQSRVVYHCDYRAEFLERLERGKNQTGFFHMYNSKTTEQAKEPETTQNGTSQEEVSKKEEEGNTEENTEGLEPAAEEQPEEKKEHDKSEGVEVLTDELSGASTTPEVDEQKQNDDDHGSPEGKEEREMDLKSVGKQVGKTRWLQWYLPLTFKSSTVSQPVLPESSSGLSSPEEDIKGDDEEGDGTVGTPKIDNEESSTNIDNEEPVTETPIPVTDEKTDTKVNSTVSIAQGVSLVLKRVNDGIKQSFTSPPPPASRKRMSKRELTAEWETLSHNGGYRATPQLVPNKMNAMKEMNRNLFKIMKHQKHYLNVNTINEGLRKYYAGESNARHYYHFRRDGQNSFLESKDHKFRQIAKGDGVTHGLPTNIRFRISMGFQFHTGSWRHDVFLPAFVFPNIIGMLADPEPRSFRNILPYAAHMIDDEALRNEIPLTDKNIYTVSSNSDLTMGDLFKWRAPRGHTSRFSKKKTHCFTSGIASYLKAALLLPEEGLDAKHPSCTYKESSASIERFNKAKDERLVKNAITDFIPLVTSAYIEAFMQVTGYRTVGNHGSNEASVMAYDFFIQQRVPDLGFLLLSFMGISPCHIDGKKFPFERQETLGEIQSLFPDSISLMKHMQRSSDRSCLTEETKDYLPLGVVILKSPYFFKFVLRALLFWVGEVNVDTYETYIRLTRSLGLINLQRNGSNQRDKNSPQIFDSQIDQDELTAANTSRQRKLNESIILALKQKIIRDNVAADARKSD